jgi:hypothetical protein
LNGLGTRGVMLGPAMAKALYENIEYQVPLNTEIDIKDFFQKNYRVILYLGHRNKHVDVNISGPTQNKWEQEHKYDNYCNKSYF